MSGAPRVPGVIRLLDQARVDAYADAARDQNAIHLDPEAARRIGLSGTAAHGMLVLALVSEAMTAAFGERWARGGSLKVRWRAPAVVPVTVTASVELRSDAGGVATYNVSCVDERGELLLTGAASASYE